MHTLLFRPVVWRVRS